MLVKYTCDSKSRLAKHKHPWDRSRRDPLSRVNTNPNDDDDGVYMMMGHFVSRLFEGTLHVGKIHVRFKIANITHALPVPVHWQTDFTPKRVVVSRLRDIIARFRTGVKFSLR